MPNLKQAGLGLAIPLFECGDGLLMEEELEPLLGVVMAQLLKRGSGRPERIKINIVFYRTLWHTCNIVHIYIII